MDASVIRSISSSHAHPAQMPQPVARLVLAIGGTDREYVAQQWAFQLGAALSAPVFGVHVAREGSDPPQDVFRYSEQLAQKWNVQYRTQILWGHDVAKVLGDELLATDLLVMGTRRLARQFHMGSVAAELLREAPCPIQLVRLPD